MDFSSPKKFDWSVALLRSNVSWKFSLAEKNGKNCLFWKLSKSESRLCVCQKTLIWATILKKSPHCVSILTEKCNYCNIKVNIWTDWMSGHFNEWYFFISMNDISFKYDINRWRIIIAIHLESSFSFSTKILKNCPT